MIESKNKLISLAVAAVLAGCAGPQEKPMSGVSEPTQAKQAPVEMAAKPVVAPAPAPKEEPAKEVVVEAPKVAETPKVEAPAPKAEPAPAAPKVQHKIPTDPNTFLVVSEEKGAEHPSKAQGANQGFTVNGVQGKELVVTRGEEYKFIVDTGVQHDFYITTNPKGWGTGTYSNGVEGQFVYKGEVSFKPNEKTPDLLYYQCRNHKFMGGKIYVLDKGEDIAKLKASLAAKDSAATSTRRTMATATEGSVKQKLSYASMVMGSGSAKRVEESGNAEAIAILKDARAKVDAAKNLLAQGKYQEAMDSVNEGLRQMTAASRAITSESEMAGVNHKAKHEELLGSLKTYEGSYKQNLSRAAKMKQEVKQKLDDAAYKKLVDEGKSLGAKGDYVNANKSLEKAQVMITQVLTNMLHAQTVTYDKNFDTPEEEYNYELARLESYEELIPLAIEQKQPSQRSLKLIDTFIDKATKIKGEGLDVAKKGDYKMAIMAMQAATSNLQRALRMMGVN